MMITAKDFVDGLSAAQLQHLIDYATDLMHRKLVAEGMADATNGYNPMRAFPAPLMPARAERNTTEGYDDLIAAGAISLQPGGG